MREIKFRAWDGSKFHYYTSLSGLYGVLNPIEQEFTGLRDRNGVEIYEGDIVIALSEQGFDHGLHKGKAFEVFWFKENGAWYIQRKYREEEKMSPMIFIYEMLPNCDVGIIGNIYENPELLNNAN